MPKHPFNRPEGRIEVIQVVSPSLEDNLLGDPSERSVAVYLPPGFTQSFVGLYE